MFCTQLSVFFVSGIYIIIHLTEAQPSQEGICSDVSKGEPLMCCKNYRVVGNSCEECWPGTYGVDCNERCPPNFYGRICKEMCSCSPCDNVRGCSNALEQNQSRSRCNPISLQRVPVLFTNKTHNTCWISFSYRISCAKDLGLCDFNQTSYIPRSIAISIDWCDLYNYTFVWNTTFPSRNMFQCVKRRSFEVLSTLSCRWKLLSR
ncbi:uncharacterized protein LOC144618454 isoform X2 [Crassostrea virginica]